MEACWESLVSGKSSKSISIHMHPICDDMYLGVKHTDFFGNKRNHKPTRQVQCTLWGASLAPTGH